MTEKSTDTPRDRIVAAADRLYYARGFSAVGMDELRTEAGVSLRRLYELFPSKDSIILAVLAHRHTMWEDGVRAAVDAADGPQERLLAIYDYLAEWFCADDFRGCGFINAFGELGGTRPAVADAVREHKAGFQAQLAQLAADAGAPDGLSAQLAMLAEGAQTTAAISHDPGVAAQARAAAVTLIGAAAN
ncbi:MAG: TetR/AcrR family transcriptional regulator [Mycetocola sp.]